MGKVVSKSEQLNKAQSLISCATERQQDVYNVMMALESDDAVQLYELYEMLH